MEQVVQVLSDPAASALIAGVIVTAALQLLKKVSPWLARRATANKKRLVAALAAMIATVGLQLAAGKQLGALDWSEIIKVASAAFGVATGAHTLVVSSAYKSKEGDA